MTLLLRTVAGEMKGLPGTTWGSVPDIFLLQALNGRKTIPKQYLGIITRYFGKALTNLELDSEHILCSFN